VVALELPARLDSGVTPEAMPVPQCAPQVLASELSAVPGTIHGPKVDGEVCDNGLGTFFLGPGSTDLAPYDQDYFTTTENAGAAPAGSNGHGSYGFLIYTPADALFATLSGWTGASAPAVGTYDYASNCGWLDFDVTFPAPPGVVCTTLFGPCDPGCELTDGEDLPLCMPAYPTLHYRARSAATCGPSQDPAQGTWQLSITAVSPLAVPNGFQHFQTHGHLAATLVNQDDPSDSVVLNLDF